MRFQTIKAFISSCLRLTLLGCLLSTATLTQAQQPQAATAPATPQDEKRLAAQKLVTEAQELYAKGTAESRRKALENYQAAAAMWHVSGDKAEEAAALSDIGTVYDSLGEKQKALEFLNQALPLRREAGDRQGEATTLINLGAVYRSLGEVRKAVEYYDRSLLISRSIGDRESEASTLNNLGAAYRALGELQKALDAYAQALPLWKALSNRRGEAVTLSNLGGVYRSLGEPEKSLEFYNESLASAREAKDRRIEGETLNNIGAVHRALGNQQQALEFFNQALEIRRAVGDRRGEVITLNNLGGVAVSLAEYPKALELYQQTLKLWRVVGDRSGEASALHNIGEVFYINGEKDTALKYFSDALILRRAVEDYQGEATTLYGIARIARDTGDLSEAQREIEAVLVIVENLRSKVANPELRASYFANVQKYYEFYISLLMSLHKQTPAKNFDASALQASERARARGLLDLLQEAKVDLKQNVEAKLLAQEKTLLDLINAKAALQVQAYGNPQKAAAAKSLGVEINQLSDEYETLQAQIKRSNPRYAGLTDTQPIALADMQKSLDRQTLLLEYKLGDERSFLWHITPDKLESYELPPRAEIETLARQTYQLLIERNRRIAGETTALNQTRIAAADAQLQKSASRLNQILLAPVASQLGNKRLVIVADGALQFIPFGVLTAPNSEQALIAANEVVTLPSIAVLAELRRLSGRVANTRASVAVFADPVFEQDDPRLQQAMKGKSGSQKNSTLPQAVRDFEPEQNSSGLPRLLASREEAKTIMSFAPRSTFFSALDFEASRERATSAEVGQYRVVHFATHGLLNTTRPELSGIVLSLYDAQGNARDGFLRLNQIYNLRLSSDLVVLSACRTALGKEIKGEGLIGLTRGFMYAGAPRVIASLWKVNDEATSELMKLFYRNLLQKRLTASQALREAQVEMQKQARWRSPYYWGAFVLQGDWR